jgi:predicted nucleic acid-binding protein
VASPILVDTDVLVDFLRGYPVAVELIEAHSDRIILSSVVVAELYAGVKGDAEQATLDALVGLFRVVPVSAGLAKAGSLLRRAYAASHGVGLADALVAATAEAEGAELKTLNVKHFPMIRGLKPAYAKPSSRRGS